MNSTLLDFNQVNEQPKSEPTFIKVIGVGGGGGNAVSHMYQQGINGVDFLVCNTDQQALNSSPVPQKILIGTGLGAGNKPDVAKRAAEDKADEIKQILSHDTKMLFITATLGGGTGTGASPVIARIAKEIELEDEEIRHILVVAVVTMPFKWERARKMNQAMEGLEALRQYADAILIINNEKLRSFGDLDIKAGFNKANDVLLIAAKSISEIITRTDYVNTDFRDVNTILAGSGTAYMGTGIGKGEDRALQAIQAAADSQLLNDTDISGAKNVLFYVSFPSSQPITMDELSAITDYLERCVNDEDINMVWGLGDDNTLTDELKVTLIVTGFDGDKQTSETSARTSEPKVEILPLDPDPEPVAEKPEPAPVAQQETPQVADIEDIKLKSEIKAEPQPVVAVAPEPITSIQHEEPVQPAEPERTVWTLDGEEEPVATSEEPAPVAALEQPVAQQAVVDEIDNMRVINTVEKPAPVAEVKPETTQSSQWNNNVATLFGNNSDNNRSEMVKSRSERIRMMNQLLHNDPDGPAKVEQMNPMNNSSNFSFPFEGNYSQRSEITSTVHSDGTITKPNDFFQQKLD